ncbi:Hypothetical_protein [Hexamita inflata]|uniref:Hypothetical_protein n=1 Tax=Hexamita inflata TaxID=28002 RepID=A0AA86QNE0_9EUKA|nr:Hypothetical protein HINF_LOCUS43869 [Hexamita inflata]
MSQNMCKYCNQTKTNEKYISQTQQLQALLPATSALIQKHYNNIPTQKQQILIDHLTDTMVTQLVQLENKEIQTDELVYTKDVPKGVPIEEVNKSDNQEIDSRLNNQANVIQAQIEEIQDLKNKLAVQTQNYIEETQKNNQLQTKISENIHEKDQLLHQISRMKAEISFLQDQMK